MEASGFDVLVCVVSSSPEQDEGSLAMFGLSVFFHVLRTGGSRASRVVVRWVPPSLHDPTSRFLRCDALWPAFFRRLGPKLTMVRTRTNMQ